MDRQIEFTLTSDQIEILCNHFGVNPEEQEDFELCDVIEVRDNKMGKVIVLDMEMKMSD